MDGGSGLRTRVHLRWVFAVQATLLVVAAWRNLHQLNPDAIAYNRIAGYYASGQWELAITGYWGPLLSWLMLPMLKVGLAPLVAARGVMALSGVVFLCGAVAVFRVFRLPRVGLQTGAWIAMGWSVFWSVRHITPDLLMAGLVGLAVSATMRLFLAPCRRIAFPASVDHQPRASVVANRSCARALRFGVAAGLWWGMAYLAKAVALPLAVLTTAGLAVFALSGRGDLRVEIARRLGLVWLGTALVAAPWIGLLSLHYGKFTFSTTGPIAHALAGPGEDSRYHPAMVTLHQPDAGRLTQWEEPSRMAYRYWSPFADGQSWQHQLRVMQGNVGVVAGWLLPAEAWLTNEKLPAWRRWLSTFDFLGLAMIALWLGLLDTLRWLARLRRQRWCWAMVPVAALAALYLPFFVMAEDNRYFYAVWPCLWVVTLNASPPRGRWRRVGFRLMAWAFAIPAVLWCGAALRGLPNSAAVVAQHLAVRLRADRVSGPLAGSAVLPGGRTGLYTAFLLGERWLGDAPQAKPAEFEAVGARTVVLRSGSWQADAFARDPRWHRFEAEKPATLHVFIRENP